MRRDDICLYLGPANRAELQVLIANRNTARKLVWRAEILLGIADGCGTVEIMRRAKTSKPTVWRWQARYLDEGVAGLRRDKTRPSRVLPKTSSLGNDARWTNSMKSEGIGNKRQIQNTSGPILSHPAQLKYR